MDDYKILTSVPFWFISATCPEDHLVGKESNYIWVRQGVSAKKNFTCINNSQQLASGSRKQDVPAKVMSILMIISMEVNY